VTSFSNVTCTHVSEQALLAIFYIYRNNRTMADAMDAEVDSQVGAAAQRSDDYSR